MSLIAPVSSAPIGSILAFAGDKRNLPSNWRECDGSLFDRTTYPELADRIGASWGGDAATTMYLPDLRGMFLRGVEGPRDGGRPQVDRDGDDREHARPELPNPGNGGRHVGSVQTSMFQTHDHDVRDPGHGHDVVWGTIVGAGAGTFERSHRDDGAPHPRARNAQTGITVASRGGAETRPVNAYIVWIIRMT